MASDEISDGPQKWRAAQGSAVLIGRPAHPLPEERLALLRGGIQRFDDILFAYIPKLYIKGRIDPPRQVCYLVLRDSACGRVEAVMQSIAPLVQRACPPGEFIDLFPVFKADNLLATVVRTGCVLCINDKVAHDECVANAAREN
jgi:hypothetical protein